MILSRAIFTKVLYLGVVCLALTIWLSYSLPAHGSSDNSSCSKLAFMFVRGSGQQLKAPEFLRWDTMIHDQLSSTSITFSSTELGTEPAALHRYPAVAVGMDHVLTDLGASASGGQGFTYGQSVTWGAIELSDYIDAVAVNCPDTQIILGGYSQGAQVVGQAVDSLPDEITQHITFLALFGDPRLNLPEGSGFKPSACSGQNLSTWRRDVPNCHTSSGSLGSASYYASKSIFTERTGLWCADHDYVCGSSSSFFDTSGHGTYANANGPIDDAITEALVLASSKLPAKLAHELDAVGDRHDIYINESLRCSNAFNVGAREANAAIQAISEHAKATNGRDLMSGYLQRADGVIPSTQELVDMINQAYTVHNGAPIVIYTFVCTPSFGMWARTAAANMAYSTQSSITLGKNYIFNASGAGVSCQSDANTFCLPLDDSAGEVAVATLVHSSQISFRSSSYQATPGTSIHFSARPFYRDTLTDTIYSWDFDNDNVTDEVTSIPVVDHTYQAPYDGTVNLLAEYSNKGISKTNARVLVTASQESPPDRPPKATGLKAAKTSPSEILFSWDKPIATPLYWSIIINNSPYGLLAGDADHFTLRDVDFNSTYTFKIAAISTNQIIGEYTPLSYDPSLGFINSDSYDSAATQQTQNNASSREVQPSVGSSGGATTDLSPNPPKATDNLNESIDPSLDTSPTTTAWIYIIPVITGLSIVTVLIMKMIQKRKSAQPKD